MKKILSVLVGIVMMLSFASCTRNNTNADRGNDGMIEDAGNAVNDVLDGAENVVDDVTGSNEGKNNQDNANNSGMNDNNQNK